MRGVALIRVELGQLRPAALGHLALRPFQGRYQFIERIPKATIFPWVTARRHKRLAMPKQGIQVITV